MQMNDINAYIASVKSRIDLFVEQYFSSKREEIPYRLYEVINYAVFPGGKMLRPALLFGVCEELGSNPQIALPVASAIELIHTFSLIHDDLPCMDNDDYRRGRETVHKKYSEALALLSGDALLADAFGIVADADKIPEGTRCRIIGMISHYVGSSGMIGGQVLDIESQNSQIAFDPVTLIRLKTSNMFILASLCGALCSGRTFQEEGIIKFGEDFGLLFQLTDDIIDFRQDKKGSFNIVMRDGFSRVFKQVDETYSRIIKFIEISEFNLGIIKGITDLVLKRVENIRNAEES